MIVVFPDHTHLLFLYAADFSSCLCGLMVVLRKPNVWFAFFVMLALCVPPAKVVRNGDP